MAHVHIIDEGGEIKALEALPSLSECARRNLNVNSVAISWQFFVIQEEIGPTLDFAGETAERGV